MSAQHVYDYAVVRIVPRVEREEFINVGVILHCRAKRFLATRIDLNETRLRAFAPHADIDAIKAHLAMLVQSCEGDGPIGKLPLPERFQWLAAPRSTIIQVSEPHAGLCDDPAATLDGLMDSLVGVGAG